MSVTRYFLPFLFSCVCIGAFAQAGLLDETFEFDGIANTLIAGNQSNGNEVICQDGKIYVGGRVYVNSTTAYPFIAKYNDDGLLDDFFGSFGATLTDFGADVAVEIFSFLIQPDGKILGAGSIGPGVLLSIQERNFFLIRYNADGSLDESFGDEGYVDFNVSDGVQGDIISDIALDNEGRIVVCGQANILYFPDQHFDFALARFSADGEIDDSFGDGGVVITDAGSTTEGASALVIQPDGKIVIAGSSYVDDYDQDYFIIRYNSNGTKDEDFGTAGIFIASYGTSFDGCSDIALQGDGSFIAAGAASQDGQNGFGVVKITPDGEYDETFGTGGKFFHAVNDGLTFGGNIAMQPDGKIIIAGVGSGASYDFALIRVNSNGTLDASFGTDGETLTDFDGGDDRAAAVTLDEELRIVVTGSVTVSGYAASGLARYTTDLDPDAIVSTGEYTGVNVYPNPASGNINFEIKELLDRAELSVSDISGNTVLRSLINTGHNKINCSSLPAGIYYYKIITVDGIVATGKIITE